MVGWVFVLDVLIPYAAMHDAQITKDVLQMIIIAMRNDGTISTEIYTAICYHLFFFCDLIMSSGTVHPVVFKLLYGSVWPGRTLEKPRSINSESIERRTAERLRLYISVRYK